MRLTPVGPRLASAIQRPGSTVLDFSLNRSCQLLELGKCANTVEHWVSRPTDSQLHDSKAR